LKLLPSGFIGLTQQRGAVLCRKERIEPVIFAIQAGIGFGIQGRILAEAFSEFRTQHPPCFVAGFMSSMPNGGSRRRVRAAACEKKRYHKKTKNLHRRERY
jgi:hypothetical protein